MTDPVFTPFPKIARLYRDIIITEKIDGTNASVHIGEDGSFRTASRNRWITPENDNAGFSRWASQHREELMQLGPGAHFGEWWGTGIQRGYHLSEKRFSLFNVSRWGDDTIRPACCRVVPVLYRGPFSDAAVQLAMSDLATGGSLAAPGFPDPEGIVVFHTASGTLFKYTFGGDGAKGLGVAA